MKVIFFFGSILFCQPSFASPIPCSFRVASPEAKPASAYDIGKAYGASLLVAIGSAKSFTRNQPQEVRLSQVIKGSAPELISLEGIHESGTDPWGAALTPDGDYLLLLKGGSRYSWVDQGSACPNSFKVTNGKVKFGETQVEVKNLKTYFESGPKPMR